MASCPSARGQVGAMIPVGYMFKKAISRKLQRAGIVKHSYFE
jgi:hypothetical protein